MINITSIPTCIPTSLLHPTPPLGPTPPSSPRPTTKMDKPEINIDNQYTSENSSVVDSNKFIQDFAGITEETII